MISGVSTIGINNRSTAPAHEIDQPYLQILRDDPLRRGMGQRGEGGGLGGQRREGGTKY